MNIDNISKRNDAESVKHKQVACRDKSKYKCACGKVYDSRSSLTRHIDSLSMSYTCPHCSKVCVSSKGFNQHLDSKVCKDISSFSKRNDDESDKHKRVDCKYKNKFKCACGIVYDHEGSLNSHIESKTITYTCPHCSKVIYTSKGFKRHLDSRVCRKDTSDDDNDDDDDDDDDDIEVWVFVNDCSSSSDSSSRKSQSRPPSTPSNARGSVIIVSLD